MKETYLYRYIRQQVKAALQITMTSRPIEILLDQVCSEIYHHTFDAQHSLDEQIEIIIQRDAQRIHFALHQDIEKEIIL